ncbi:hypothetical protein FIBSPDRAFT_850260 [Athelia psychrophila]|uniref:Uncharacterized protein n=1 Tax=Athelia psychrophila TaxID=1759441 RepID=A0A166TP33_9AGAM|nr:hypothetical protein FIBSPDRAFT_850260 [Fibularhizoctonia sp. CBS 109695]
MLGESTDDYGEYIESDETRWPNLQIVAVADPHRSAMVPALLSRLQDAGHPLRKLLLSYTIVSQANVDIMEELEVELEGFIEDWPTPFERAR